MNEVERRLCDFTLWSAVQYLSCHTKNIGLLNRRMAHTVFNRWSSTNSYQNRKSCT
jgi:hypothetical protein